MVMCPIFPLPQSVNLRPLLYFVPRWIIVGKLKKEIEQFSWHLINIAYPVLIGTLYGALRTLCAYGVQSFHILGFYPTYGVTSQVTKINKGNFLVHLFLLTFPNLILSETSRAAHRIPVRFCKKKKSKKEISPIQFIILSLQRHSGLE